MWPCFPKCFYLVCCFLFLWICASGHAPQRPWPARHGAHRFGFNFCHASCPHLPVTSSLVPHAPALAVRSVLVGSFLGGLHTQPSSESLLDQAQAPQTRGEFQVAIPTNNGTLALAPETLLSCAVGVQPWGRRRSGPHCSHRKRHVPSPSVRCLVTRTRSARVSERRYHLRQVLNEEMGSGPGNGKSQCRG